MKMRRGILIVRFRRGFGRQACAGASIEREFVPPGKPFVVAAVGAKTGEREIYVAVKCQFFGSEPECGTALMVTFD